MADKNDPVINNILSRLDYLESRVGLPKKGAKKVAAKESAPPELTTDAPPATAETLPPSAPDAAPVEETAPPATA